MAAMYGLVLQLRNMDSVCSVLQQRRDMDSSLKEGMPMNWEVIVETVQKYWVQQLCVLAVGIITA